MRTHGIDRLLTFCDAVVAIAATLLVLPLVEIPTGLRAGSTVGDVLDEHAAELGSFLLGFVVIWALWTTHHRVMSYFARYDATLLRLHLLWLLTIVLLPFTTQLIDAPDPVDGAEPVYVGVLLVSALALWAMAAHGRQHRELLRGDPDARGWAAESDPPTTAAIIAVALVLVLVVPAVGAWPLLLLLVDDQVDALVDRLRRRRGGRGRPR